MSTDTPNPTQSEKLGFLKNKTFLWTLAGVVLGILGVIFFMPKSPQEEPSQPSLPPLMSLENMGHLVTLKVNYSNVIGYSNTKDSWLGGTKVLYVARGDCLIAADIRQAKYVETNEAARSTTLILPAPRALSPRVNHDSREKGGSYFYDIDGTGVVNFLPDSESRRKANDGVLRQAQKEVEKACAEREVIESAKKNTETVLKPAFTATGWSVNFRWQ